MKTHYWKNSGKSNSINQKGAFFLSRPYSLFVTSKIYAVASMSACHLLLNKFPSPQISFSKKIQEGHVDVMKALKVLKMKDKKSEV